MEWFLKCIRQYSDFKGRARRKEFWMFTLTNFIISLIFFILDFVLVLYAFPGDGVPVFTLLYTLPMLFPSYSVVVRRLHDIGKSGWFFLKYIIAIGILSIVAFFLFYFSNDDPDYSIFTFIQYISGIIIILAEIVIWIWFIVLLSKEGETGENKWGLNPKDPLTPEDEANTDCFKYFVKCFEHYFDFSGRAHRSEFWMFIAVNVIIQFIFYTFEFLFLATSEWLLYFLYIISAIYNLAVFFPSLAVLIRRLHDIGKSGWWVITPYVVIFIIAIMIMILVLIFPNNPLVVFCPPILLFLGSLIWFYYILAKDSQPGKNKWGPNPKEDNKTENIDSQTVEIENIQ